MIRVRRNLLQLFFKSESYRSRISSIHSENIWDLNVEIFLSLNFCYLKYLVHTNHRPTCIIPSASKHFPSHNNSDQNFAITTFTQWIQSDIHLTVNDTMQVKQSTFPKGKNQFLNKHCFVFICSKTHCNMNFHGRVLTRF